MALDYATVVKQANEVLAQYRMRLTLRQVFYRLVARYGLPNTHRAYKNLGNTLTRARERGDVDWRRIEDRVRGVFGTAGFRSPESFREAFAESVEVLWEKYRRNLWLEQGHYLEVWVEKDALSALFKETADEYVLKTAPSRGYGSHTYLRETVDRLNAITGRKVVVLHFGDHDPSGRQMSEDLGRRLRLYGARNATVLRPALNPDQIRDYNLPPAPVKLTDSRAKRFIEEFGTDVVELDALDPDDLQAIIRQSIEQFITNKAKFKSDLKEMAEEQEALKPIFAEAARAIREG